MRIKTLIIAALATAIGAQAYAGEATGAGSSFFMPLATKWADGYNKATGHRVNYQSIGSGAGIKQIDAKTVTFGATDAPVKPDDLAKKAQVQFPITVGGIVMAVNLKEVKQLTLNLDIVAKIYMDKIKSWNDAEIAALNPGVNLPDLPIIKIRRSDGSGTTWNFTKYLSEANADWKKDFGQGASIEWSGSAIGAKGNEGVAANVMQVNGSIGYVEYAFAKQNNITAADMIGSDGKKVSPGIKAFQGTWPMIAVTYVLMYVENPDPEATKIAKGFFEYTMDNDAVAEALDYVPLNAAQKAEVKKTLASIK
jgi:phosphate transport system substrate-binding protein